MPQVPAGVRSAVALFLAALTALAGLLIVLPSPSYTLWVARLACLETGFATALVALVAVVIALSGGPRTKRDRWAVLVALPALVVALVPPLGTLRAYSAHGPRFSVVEYVRGVSAPPVEVCRDVVLDPGQPHLTSDIYPGLGPGPHPFVVVVHGGSWHGGDKGAMSYLSRLLAARGATVVDVRYRLAPTAPFPAAVADVKCLLGRLRERARELDLAPERGALLGRSAGGQIALVAAYSVNDPRLPPSCAVAEAQVQAVVALYAPTELAWAHDNPLRPDVVDGPRSLEIYLAGTPQERPEDYRLASPLAWADRPLPRTLLIHGAGDRFVSIEHARRLCRGLRDRRQPVDLVELPFADHAFDVRPGGVGEQLARGKVLKFLAPLVNAVP